jgi:hypothetical protein
MYPKQSRHTTLHAFVKCLFIFISFHFILYTLYLEVETRGADNKLSYSEVSHSQMSDTANVCISPIISPRLKRTTRVCRSHIAKATKVPVRDTDEPIENSQYHPATVPNRSGVEVPSINKDTRNRKYTGPCAAATTRGQSECSKDIAALHSSQKNFSPP